MTIGKRVAIVGAGPGGLAAGIALHQAGFDVRIFERSAEVTPLGGAVILNATGIVILRKFGVNVDEIFAAGEPVFKRYDGHVRAKFDIDPQLMQQAGVTGWQSGMMRSDLYARMLAVVPAGMIVPNHGLASYSETSEGVRLNFTNGSHYDADLLIGADGINSVVRKQLWGDSELKHLGIAVWLGWCELDGPSRTNIVLHHNDRYQMGYAPLLYQNKKCFEWWFVESCREDQALPTDVLGYIQERVKGFDYPIPEILANTDPHHQLFRWVVKYRDPLKQWSKGRVTLLGDACHPTSPYAAYGAGMAIEDGFFLGKFLAGRDLSNARDLQQGLQRYDKQRVAYTNATTAFARFLGRAYHGIPAPLRKLRDYFLDNSALPGKQISKKYTQDAQSLLRDILAEAR